MPMISWSGEIIAVYQLARKTLTNTVAPSAQRSVVPSNAKRNVSMNTMKPRATSFTSPASPMRVPGGRGVGVGDGGAEGDTDGMEVGEAVEPTDRLGVGVGKAEGHGGGPGAGALGGGAPLACEMAVNTSLQMLLQLQGMSSLSMIANALNGSWYSTSSVSVPRAVIVSHATSTATHRPQMCEIPSESCAERKGALEMPTARMMPTKKKGSCSATHSASA
mmetsp:Transcript_719/g.2562  ORF Transcript_719/g.2562 Transcript_719/m.2562 type:complete len:220 (-) Transcript_719:130-789(-)